MAFTQTDLDAVDRAIASGELTVRQGQKIVTYRSADELLALRSEIAREIYAAASPGRPVPRHQLADFSDDS